MKRAEAINLSELNIPATLLPDRGETMLHDAVVPGLALRLRASGARSWVVHEKLNQRQIRRTLGDALLIPLDTARRLAAVVPSDPPATSDTPLPALIFSPDARVRDVMPRFLAAGESSRWKASTVRTMRAVVDTHILPLLGHRMVRAITPEEVTRWHLDVTAKSSAERMALSTLSGLMLYAEDHGLRDHGSNPCRGLTKKKRSKRGQLLPAATVKRLWAALDTFQERMPDACDAIRLLFLTGARRSEILKLEWDRIIGFRAVLKDSKTGPRTIWLNTPALAILDARRASVTGPYVFPAPKKEGSMTVLDRQWSLIRREARVDNLRVHDLRHHFASVAVSNGMDLRLVGQLLGHHDIDSTLCYSHLTTDALVRSATRVSGRIDRSLRGERLEPTRRPRSAQNAINSVTVDAPMEATHG